MYLCLAMSLIKFALLFFLAYIAYRFVFGFLLPVTRATRNVRRQFKAAQEQMEAQMRAQQGYQAGGQYGAGSQAGGGAHVKPESRGQDAPRKSDYIDFEEVRD